MTRVIKIAVLPGDGIGPEIMEQALRVFAFLSESSKYKYELRSGLIGGAAWDKTNNHFPDETKELCSSSDVVFFGAVGGPVSEQANPKWFKCEVNSILALRKLLSLYGNLRPVKLEPALFSMSPLNLTNGSKTPDLVVVRELSGDIYFGDKRSFIEDGIRVATDECRYDEVQIRRIAELGFDLAMKRSQHLVSVDKANVLETSRLWRDVVTEVSASYPEVKFSSMLVDNCAMQLIKDPCYFDVVLTSNMFGDILSDMAAVIPGSLGLLDSASVGEKGIFLFEPPSGSAPDIAGLNIANPIGMIRCISSFFTLVSEEVHISARLERGIQILLERGVCTRDLRVKDGVGTSEFVDCLLTVLQEHK